MDSGTSSAILVHTLDHKICAFCNENLSVEEGVMIYDKNWYHNGCWDSFEKTLGGKSLD